MLFENVSFQNTYLIYIYLLIIYFYILIILCRQIDNYSNIKSDKLIMSSDKLIMSKATN